VHSPFTGVTRLRPLTRASVEISDTDHSALSMLDIAVGIVDAHGTMTKAAGTLVWMGTRGASRRPKLLV